jgi:hypothetical protein
VDTGAGTSQDDLELILTESDCRLCGDQQGDQVVLTGAYRGTFNIYSLRVQVPALGFDQDVEVVAVPSGFDGFDGTATFPFLNRFHYGNFGNPAQFGLET